MRYNPIARFILWATIIVALWSFSCSSTKDNSEVTTDTKKEKIAQQQDARQDSSTDLSSKSDSIGKIGAALTKQCTPPTSDIVINEVMIDPSDVADDKGEWFELYNPHGYEINIKGWTVRDTNGEHFTIDQDLVVPPDGYVVLCRNADKDTNGGVTCNYQYSGMQFDNTGDSIILEDASGKVIDQTGWSSTAPTGASVELRHPYLDNSDMAIPQNPNDPESWKNSNSNWAVAGVKYGDNDKGTPGAKNADVYVEQEVSECDDGKLCTWDLCIKDQCDNSHWKKGCCTGDADCDDGNVCTKDTCNVDEHKCEYSKVEGCCNKAEECQGWDNNPCNYDTCNTMYHYCESYGHVADCCWAPEDINPDTGNAWSSPDERQQWADRQCDDKNPCTVRECNLDENKCVTTKWIEGCCVYDSDCDDHNRCTDDHCVNNTCTHKWIKDCCNSDSECHDDDPCTDDRCIFGWCRFLPRRDGICCGKDADCNENPNPCVDTKCINGRCQDIPKSVCTIQIPYKETFDSTTDFAIIGYKRKDYSANSAKDHWLIVDSPNKMVMGPDKFPMFNTVSVPDGKTTKLVKSVLVSPILDCTTSEGYWNFSKKTTLEWTQVYYHGDAGGKVTLKVMASQDGDFNSSNAVVLKEWKDLDHDLKVSIEKAPLPDSMKFASKVYIGFMVETDDTWNLNSWRIDDVILSPGTPNYVIQSQVWQCFDKDCNDEIKRVDVTGSDVPNIAMYTNQHYRVWVMVREPDIDPQSQAYYSPVPDFLGDPFDTPDFIYFPHTDFGDMSQFCARQSYDNKFYCIFDIDPNNDDTNAGEYDLGFRVRDDNTGGQFSLHESLSLIKLTVIPVDGYIVWVPSKHYRDEGQALVDLIKANGRKAQMITDIMNVPDFDQIRGIFVLLGVHGSGHILTNAEAQKLADYLDNGGRIYLEGGDFWYTTDLGGSQPVTPLHKYFKIKALYDGEARLEGPIRGSNFLWQYDYDYPNDSQHTLYNAWIDHIKHFPQAGGREILRKTDNVDKPFALAVSYEDPDTKYRTIGSSALLGGLEALNGGHTKEELVGKYIDFLENGYPPCQYDEQCDDFEACTDDKCDTNTLQCKNIHRPNCVPCMNDVYKEDGTLSCGEDQACWVAKGYCVDIKPFTVKASAGNVDRQVGSMQSQIQSKIHISQPGKVQALNVKVKITHTYRGDLSVDLSHGGETSTLVKHDQTDARENIYETYNIGVPAADADAISRFQGKPLQGDWYLTVTDHEPHMDNGILNTWRIYATYEPWTCQTDADCNDNNACTTDTCVNGECHNDEKDCDDGNPGTLDSCDPDTGECIHTPTDHCPNCPCKYHSDCGYDDVCLNSSGVTCDPVNDTNCTCEPIPGQPFYADDVNALPKSIPDNNSNGVVLTRVIKPDENETAAEVIKRLRVKVVTNHTSISDLKVKLCHEDTNTCITLHNYSGGQNVGFYDVYDYDPVDGPGALNDFKGEKVAGTWKLYLYDNVPGHFGTVDHWTLYVVSTQCYTNEDCDDNNLCTVDTCVVNNDDGTCQHTAITCQQPDNQCQEATCNPDTGQCETHNKANGSPCEDGKYCTVDDYCENGACQAGSPRDCSYLDGECVVGQCSEQDQSCIQVPKPDGTSCDDGEACTQGDYCEGGQCKAGDTMVCECETDADCKDDGLVCNGVIGKCDTTTHKCTYIEGKEPVQCPQSPNPCQEYECTEPDGTCVLKNKPDYTPCEDGKYCTVGDECIAGECKSGQTRDCSSLDDQCHIGVCDEDANACVKQNKPNGTECEADGEGCTVDQCEDGQCVYVEDRDCSQNVPDCHIGYCQNVGYGGWTCKVDQLPDGSSCSDDGNPCTDDQCESGTCKHVQSEHCTAACGGEHPYDAGDDKCGTEDSCAGGINGAGQGQCTPTCTGANCMEFDSGQLDLPVSENIGCTISTITVNSTYEYVDQAIVKMDLDHQNLGDLTIYLKDPQGYEHILWDYLGQGYSNFSNTFDVSFPLPYQLGSNPPVMDSGAPMCRFKGEKASGDWTLYVCDGGNGDTGVLHSWRLYIKGADQDNNPGHRCESPIELPTEDGEVYRPWNTMCAANMHEGFGSTGGVDRVYKLVLDKKKHVTVKVPQDKVDAKIYVLPADGDTCASDDQAMYAVDNVHNIGSTVQEVWDNQLPPGTYYFVIDVNGHWYSYVNGQGEQVAFRMKAPGPDGSDCISDLDCQSGHCQNGYCCDHGDCCPGDAWTQNGEDPTPLENDPNWQSAHNVCPAKYTAPGECSDTKNCQGHRWDANCINHMCVKQEVKDDSFCTANVLSDYCGNYKSVYCNGNPVQQAPQCLDSCTSDTDCDSTEDGAGNCKNGCHCDPQEGATLPDDQSQHLICTDNLPDGSASNEDSDCISDHSQNGFCCQGGDCCNGDADVCPDSYASAPVCKDQANCYGERKDKTCVNYECGSKVVQDDCACIGKQAKNCGAYIPVYCGCDNTWPPDGSCQYSDYDSCHAANPDGFDLGGAPQCLDNCGTPDDQHDDWCIDSAHCDPDPNDPNRAICIADLPNGSPCNENSDCQSKHCQNNYCCDSGDCCSGDASTCPASYSSAPTCDDASTCQGHRVDAVCDTTNNKYQCGSVTVDDDSACDTDTLAQTCGYFADIYCTGEKDQQPPQCPDTCTNDLDCDPNAHCDPNECAIDDGACMIDQQSQKLVCKPNLTNDKTCNEASDCITDYCQTGFCCDQGGCCKGCKVTSFIPNMGGGGTDSLSHPSNTGVQSTAGQAGPGGHAEQTGNAGSGVNSADFGFYPGAAVRKLQ